MSSRVVSLALFSVLALSSAAPALADEILITQAKALAGNVTPGDAAGFPVTLTLPGKYRLTTNIYPTAGQTGIRAAQRNITIDLDGFELHGAGIANHGITGAHPGAAIRNGTITGFLYDGINGQLSPNWFVENMQVVGNGRYGLSVGFSSSVRGSTVRQNGHDGIECLGRCLVADSNVSDNGNRGIYIGSGTVLGNVIFDNDDHGIAGGANVGYGNNTLAFNNGGGAQVSGGGAQLHPNVCTPACP